MNRTDRLERELTAWLVASANPRTPDYAGDILRQTARVRQRPPWSFPELWLLGGVFVRARRTLQPIPWRTIGTLAILAALLILAIATLIGSQTRLPPPFGLAANGLVAYASSGDIYTVDPLTGARRPLVSGIEHDTDPRWSLDGTRLVFMRLESGGAVVPIFAGADGRNLVVADTEPVFGLDSESIAWSPDNVSVAFTALHEGLRAIYIVSAIDGGVRTITTSANSGEIFWRPPDGRELMTSGGSESDPTIVLISVDDGEVRDLPVAPGDRAYLRPSGWTPDGSRYVFMQGVTHVVELETGRRITVDTAYAQLSNDGTRLVGLAGEETEEGERTWLCVVRLDSGPCARISEIYEGPWGTYFRWSPDDQWIITTREDDDKAMVLDPDGELPVAPTWASQGAESWQRLAP